MLQQNILNIINDLFISQIYYILKKFGVGINFYEYKDKIFILKKI